MANWWDEIPNNASIQLNNPPSSNLPLPPKIASPSVSYEAARQQAGLSPINGNQSKWWHDPVVAIAQGAQGLLGGAGYVGEKLGIPGSKNLTEFAARRARDYEQLYTPETQAAEWYEPRGIGKMLAQSLPATVAGMGLGALASKGLSALGMKATTAGMTGFGAGEGLVSAGVNAGQTLQNLRDMPDDQWAKYPGYRKSLESGLTPELAKEQLANQVANQQAALTAPVTALLGAPMGAVWGNVLEKGASKVLGDSMLRRLGLVAGGESLQEMTQSGTEQLFANKAMQQLDPNQPLTEGVLQQALAGGLAGGIMGGSFTMAATPSAKQERTARATAMDQATAKLRENLADASAPDIEHALGQINEIMDSGKLPKSVANNIGKIRQELVDESQLRNSPSSLDEPAHTMRWANGYVGFANRLSELSDEQVAKAANIELSNDAPGDWHDARVKYTIENKRRNDRADIAAHFEKNPDAINGVSNLIIDITKGKSLGNEGYSSPDYNLASMPDAMLDRYQNVGDFILQHYSDDLKGKADSLSKALSLFAGESQRRASGQRRDQQAIKETEIARRIASGDKNTDQLLNSLSQDEIERITSKLESRLNLEPNLTGTIKTLKDKLIELRDMQQPSILDSVAAPTILEPNATDSNELLSNPSRQPQDDLIARSKRLDEIVKQDKEYRKKRLVSSPVLAPDSIDPQQAPLDYSADSARISELARQYDMQNRQNALLAHEAQQRQLEANRLNSSIRAGIPVRDLLPMEFSRLLGDQPPPVPLLPPPSEEVSLEDLLARNARLDVVPSSKTVAQGTLAAFSDLMPELSNAKTIDSSVPIQQTQAQPPVGVPQGSEETSGVRPKQTETKTEPAGSNEIADSLSQGVNPIQPSSALLSEDRKTISFNASSPDVTIKNRIENAKIVDFGMPNITGDEIFAVHPSLEKEGGFSVSHVETGARIGRPSMTENGALQDAAALLRKAGKKKLIQALVKHQRINVIATRGTENPVSSEVSTNSASIVHGGLTGREPNPTTAIQPQPETTHEEEREAKAAPLLKQQSPDMPLPSTKKVVASSRPTQPTPRTKNATKPAPNWNKATQDQRVAMLQATGSSDSFAQRKAIEWATWKQIPEGKVKQRLRDTLTEGWQRQDQADSNENNKPINVGREDTQPRQPQVDSEKYPHFSKNYIINMTGLPDGSWHVIDTKDGSIVRFGENPGESVRFKNQEQAMQAAEKWYAKKDQEGKAGKNKKGAKPTTATATHADPGENPEPATPAVINEALEAKSLPSGKDKQTAIASSVGDVLTKIDEAIAKAPDAPKGITVSDGAGSITIKVPEDGTFKIVNSKSALKAFRDKIVKSDAFKKSGAKGAATKPQKPSLASPRDVGSSILSMTSTGEIEDIANAFNLARAHDFPIISVDFNFEIKRGGSEERVKIGNNWYKGLAKSFPGIYVDAVPYSNPAFVGTGIEAVAARRADKKYGVRWNIIDKNTGILLLDGVEKANSIEKIIEMANDSFSKQTPENIAQLFSSRVTEYADALGVNATPQAIRDVLDQWTQDWVNEVQDREAPRHVPTPDIRNAIKRFGFSQQIDGYKGSFVKEIGDWKIGLHWYPSDELWHINGEKSHKNIYGTHVIDDSFDTTSSTDDLPQELEKAFDKAGIQYEPRQSTTVPTRLSMPLGASTRATAVSQARATLVNALGERTVATMENAGTLVFHEKDPTKNGAAGFVDHKGIIHLIPANMDQTALDVALHEGMHLARDDRFAEGDRAKMRLAHAVMKLSGLKNFIGNPGFADLVKQVNRMANEGNKIARDALNKAQQEAEHDPRVDVDEEAVAYLAQYADQKLPLVRRILATIRAALYRMGIKINLTPADVRALALSALKARAKSREVRIANIEKLENAFAKKHGWDALGNNRIEVLRQLNDDATLDDFEQAVEKVLRTSLPKQVRSDNKPSSDLGNRDVRYSRSGAPSFNNPRIAAKVLGDIGELRDNLKPGEQLLAKANPSNWKQMLSDLKSNHRPDWLGLLTQDMLLQLAKEQLPVAMVNQFDHASERMDAEESRMINKEAAPLAEQWMDLIRKNKQQVDALARAIYMSTWLGVDPRQPAPQGKNVEWIKATAAYRALTHHEARDLYGKVLDFYEKQTQQLFKALASRIQRHSLPEPDKLAYMDLLRQEFERIKQEGPYAPLMRFGDLTVWAEPRNQKEKPVFAMFENIADQRAFADWLKSEGYQPQLGVRMEEIAKRNLPQGDFVGKLADIIDKTTNGPEAKIIKDSMYQLFLRSMPEQAIRKHFIHRKFIPGYSADALRTFSSFAHHSAKQIARLMYGDKMSAAIDQMANAVRSGQVTDPVAAGHLVNELEKSYQWTMNPTTSAAATRATNLGFFWYLGGSPGHLLLNLLQQPQVTAPWLVGELVGKKSSGAIFAALLKANKDFLKSYISGKSATKSRQHLEAEYNGDLGRALNDLEKSGKTDKTQVYSISGMSEEDSMLWSRPLRYKLTKGAAWFFHVAEVINRESAAIAAYRLGRDSGMTHEQAYDLARRAINETHFDYSPSNRARFMRGNVMKVLTLFKQYSLNMSWQLWRNAYLARRGQSPQQKAMARTKLIWMLGMTAVMAGAIGMPVFNEVMWVITQLLNAMRDEDEPEWDAETEFRMLLDQALTPTVSTVVQRGLLNALTGLDISTRVKLDDLWWRQIDNDLQGKQKAYAMLEQALGPVAGLAVRGITTVSDVIDALVSGTNARGDTWRSMERAMPKIITDISKSIRFQTEGVTTAEGIRIFEPDELATGEIVGQLLGFTPARLTERYAENRAMMDLQTKVKRQRDALLDSYAMAYRQQDEEMLTEIQKDIEAFNKRYQTVAIKSKTLAQSLQARSRRQAEIEQYGGVSLDKRMADMLREASSVH